MQTLPSNISLSVRIGSNVIIPKSGGLIISCCKSEYFHQFQLNFTDANWACWFCITVAKDANEADFLHGKDNGAFTFDSGVFY